MRCYLLDARNGGDLSDRPLLLIPCDSNLRVPKLPILKPGAPSFSRSLREGGDLTPIIDPKLHGL